MEITVVAVERGEDIIVSPAGDTVLEDGDILVVLGTNEKVKELEKKHV